MNDPAADSPPPVATGRWGDLNRRMVSAGVLLIVGAFEIWAGGLTFALFVVLLTMAMIWELSRMTSPPRADSSLIMAGLAGVALTIAVFLPAEASETFLLAPALAFALTPRRDRRLSAVFAAAILVAGYGLVELRMEGGSPAVLWLLGVVIASDVLGYFAGRTFGGPKFWPKISPKKTWSGTIAGWIGAACVGLAFVLMGRADWGIVLLSPLVALSGQLGDIGESWLKRRAGVKDSSNLIPGHGGVMDRFDALTGATVAVMFALLLAELPLPMGGE